MSNIRHQINSDNNELSGYNGLIGAVIHQAVKDLQESYIKLINERNLSNYHKFKTNRLFFINSCNRYCGENFSMYILEKAIRLVDKSYPKENIKLVKEYIKIKDEEFNKD